jgi:hypothetical protein
MMKTMGEPVIKQLAPRLTMASVLKLRDQGAGMPAAVVLWSTLR